GAGITSSARRTLSTGRTLGARGTLSTRRTLGTRRTLTHPSNRSNRSNPEHPGRPWHLEHPSNPGRPWHLEHPSNLEHQEHLLSPAYPLSLGRPSHPEVRLAPADLAGHADRAGAEAKGTGAKGSERWARGVVVAKAAATMAASE
ncbi:hypothetical protein, partial [Mycolicibacterium sp. CBMA 360]|uniref:hypothetical protein n=1 Tax=Mycolicibacterium sp. CBMA 360 TaxID=2606614 RepID=UPI0023B1894C